MSDAGQQAGGGAVAPGAYVTERPEQLLSLTASNWYPAAASKFVDFGKKAVRLRFNYLPLWQAGKSPLQCAAPEEAAAAAAQGPPGCGREAIGP